MCCTGEIQGLQIGQRLQHYVHHKKNVWLNVVNISAHGLGDWVGPEPQPLHQGDALHKPDCWTSVRAYQVKHLSSSQQPGHVWVWLMRVQHPASLQRLHYRRSTHPLQFFYNMERRPTATLCLLTALQLGCFSGGQLRKYQR